MFYIKRKKLIDALCDESQSKRQDTNKSAFKTAGMEARDLKDLKRVQKYLYLIKEDIESEADKINWEESANEVINRVHTEETRLQHNAESIPGRFLSVPYKLGYAALSIAFLGFIIMLVFNTTEPALNYTVMSEKSVDNLENTLAKKETARYLEQSSIVLSTVADMPNKEIDDDLLKMNAQRAKNLLMKKKYLNHNLDNYKLAHAQSVCNQVEYILYDISQISNSSDIESITNLRNLIQDKKIMLKIKLVQSELADKEV